MALGPYVSPTAGVGATLQDRGGWPLDLWSIVLKGPAWDCCSVSHWADQQGPSLGPGSLSWICDSRALSSFISHHQMASGFIGPANPGYCEAASLLGNSWDKGIFSWACVNYELDSKNSHPTFSRTLPSPIRVLLTVMKYFQWAHAGVISSDEDIWVHTAYRVASALRSRGLPVGVVLTTGQDSQSIQKALQQIRQADRILSECFLGAQLSMWLQWKVSDPHSLG